jgi:hypothetical protein
MAPLVVTIGAILIAPFAPYNANMAVRIDIYSQWQWLSIGHNGGTPMVKIAPMAPMAVEPLAPMVTMMTTATMVKKATIGTNGAIRLPPFVAI